MLARWCRAASHYSRVVPRTNNLVPGHFYASSRLNYSEVAAAVETPVPDPIEKNFTGKTDVNLNKMFWSKPCSLALPADSPLRIEEPQFEGIKHFILRLMLFYSKQSKSIRGANAIYRRVVSQVDKPAIYNVFSLEKTFKTTFSLLVLHMWLCLRRLKEEGKEGVELGQYLYEIYNHDVELRASKAGVNLLLSRWMKDLEKIFYGNIVAYDAALLPDAEKDELQNVIWRNVFSEDGSSKLPTDAALGPVQAMSRYVRRESNCMSLTGFRLEIFYPAKFDNWVVKGEAPVINSSLDLYHNVLSLGFKVFMLTGRYERHRNITVDNLIKAGFQHWDKLITRSSEDHQKLATIYKSEKRDEMVKEGYRIVGNSGDQWSDLLGSSIANRSFKLPNPMYYIP